MKLQTKTLFTALTAAAALTAGSANNAASAAPIVVVDDVPTDTSASIDRTIGSGVTVTGSEFLAISNSVNQDPNITGWNGNAYLYRASGAGSASVTYAAAAGDSFTDFDAQVMVHNSLAATWAAASARFIFESSTDGSNFSTINVSGTYANLPGAGIADWRHFYVSTTDPSSLIDVTHLKVTVQQDTGASWQQAIASTTLEVVPEPGSLALLGLGGLMIARRRRD